MEDIVTCMETKEGTAPDIQGEYTTLKRGNFHTSTRKSNPSWADLDKVYGDYSVIYQPEDPSPIRRPLPTPDDLFQIDGGFPTEAEVEATVCRLTRNRSGGHMHLRAKYF